MKYNDKELQSIKQKIQEYQEKNKIVFFVGSGVSAISGMPNWKQLVIEIANKVGYKLQKNGDDYFISSNEYLKIPQIFYDSLAPSKKKNYFSFVRKKLNKKASTNTVHSLLMQINPYHILTTNYDNLLEQAAIETGRVYSLINSDAAVSRASTQKYIIKVHGDFEKNNFVLKEEDYLNYDENFKLIEALLKSILATNLVIFIGYSLGDYNIKLIQNWVKQVQVHSNSYIEPVFIYTGGTNRAPEIEKNYYANQSIHFIDAGEVTGKNEYEEQYREILTILFGENIRGNIGKTLPQKLNSAYSLFKEINSMKYLRAEDIAGIFYGSKLVERNILEVADSSELLGLIDAYENKNKLSARGLKNLDTLIEKIYSSGIDGIRYKKDISTLNKLIFRNGVFENHIFEDVYQDIEDSLKKYGSAAIDLYDKAYDLCMIGRFKDARECYERCASICNAEKNWTLYYLCTVNQRLLRQLTISTNSKTKGIYGYINFGKECSVYTDEEIESLKLKVVFNELPAEYSKFYFFERLRGNYYKDDMAQLFSENYKVERDIDNHTRTLVGYSNYEKIMLRMLDAISFIYENKIILSLFAEHKVFVKISLEKYLDGVQSCARLSDDKDDLDIFIKRDNTLQPDYQMILLIARNLNHKDILRLYSKYKDLRIVIKDEERIKFEYYAAAFMAYVKDKGFNEVNEENIEQYFVIHSEVGSMAILIPSICISNQVLTDYVLWSLYFVMDREMNYEEKVWPIEMALKKLEESDVGCVNALIILKDFLEKIYKNCTNTISINANRPIMLEYLILVDRYDNSGWIQDFLNCNNNEDGEHANLLISLGEELKRRNKKQGA